MSTTVLIAHKVRGKLQFDVAEECPCHVCADHAEEVKKDCDFCNGKRVWYVTVGGWRAYPFWTHPLHELHGPLNLSIREMVGTDEAPESVQDFFIIHDRQVRATRAREKVKPVTLDLTLEDLGL